MAGTFNEEALKEIEAQLSCPQGENGIEMGKEMNKTNISMTLNTIEQLGLSEQDSLLEIGPGNAGHLAKIMEVAADISYQGLDISDTMIAEAHRINASLMASHKINFTKYDGQKIPFAKETLDKVMTVNTLYFWKNPTEFLQEIARVMKPQGLLIITFAKKEFMQKLPFIGEKFSLYDEQAIVELVGTSTLNITQIIDKEEEVESSDGEKIKRTYFIVKIRK
ncbi:MAG: class I SAM-dependent methyltransferase [Thermonemataceae bacterium]